VISLVHKAIQHLIQERWLEVRPGIGTLVAEAPTARAGDKQRLLQRELEQLVVEAKHVGLELEEVVEAIESQWAKLESRRKWPQMIEVRNLWKRLDGSRHSGD
jgi:DNA-binding transcriptional regulator YhcF (GntR family)